MIGIILSNLFVNYVAEKKSIDISQIGNYFSETVKLPETVLTAPGYEYFKGLYALTVILFLISLYVLLVEEFFHKFYYKTNMSSTIESQFIFY